MNLQEWWTKNKPADMPFPGDHFIFKQMKWGGDVILDQIQYDPDKGYSITGKTWHKPTVETIVTEDPPQPTNPLPCSREDEAPTAVSMENLLILQLRMENLVTTAQAAVNQIRSITGAMTIKIDGKTAKEKGFF